MQYNEAQKSIVDMGLKLDDVEYDADSDEPPGTVIDQTRKRARCFSPGILLTLW
jgi:beta-lactam-binding protein with PASTA domain